MNTPSKKFNAEQILFKELFVGTLIYAVILGFFNDYSSIVYAKSFSTIFLASIVLEVLTYLAFVLKGKIVAALKGREAAVYRVLMFFGVWLVMFLSKFVFIWVIDIIFGENLNINGFFGILILVVCVTIVHKAADKIFVHLGDSPA
ncbi:hypothetical protein KBD20_01735 [Candidatus Saccharibacteria bacterium]|nr:hypothetical protein [Candidatus Saccharibacteria bacterium]